MPSVEQCDSAAGNVTTALPSTLEIFDKFKPATENGKDSDSEESFHIPYYDDDIESQSVVSNGRDKEIHGEETEDDILNKFEETAPSGTPDHLDPQTEDSILNDGDDEQIALSQENNDENVKENTRKIKPSNKQKADVKQSNTEVKITYSFKNYEDSCDGEFKSIYETDANPAETTTVEPMEVIEQAAGAIDKKQNISTSDDTKKDEYKDSMDNFEDCMEVEDDTNDNIASIIEKLGDQDAPMEDCETEKKSAEASSNLNESDVTVIELSDTPYIDTNKVPENTMTKQNEKVEEKDIELIDDDVEMSVDGKMDCSSKEKQEQKTESTQDSESSIEEYKVPVHISTEITNSKENEWHNDVIPLKEKEDVISEEINNVSSLPTENKNEETKSTGNPPQDDQKDVPVKSKNDASSDDSLLENLNKTTTKESEIAESKEIDKLDAHTELKEEVKQSEVKSGEEVFKIPEDVSKGPEDQRTNKEARGDDPDLCNDKSNDKTDEDEVDLLDISMVRETDEDDACAIADAMEDTDKETQASEKSDEEQSERMETEQETSDLDKDPESNDDNDNTIGFDDLDDDSRMDGDESSNAEAPVGTKNKVIEISESSKESSSDGDLKQKKSCDVVPSREADLNMDATVQQSDNSQSTDGVAVQTGISDEVEELITIEETAETDRSVDQDKIQSSDISKTDKEKEVDETSMEEEHDKTASEVVLDDDTEDNSDRRISSLNKRSHSASESDGIELTAKKAKLASGDAKSKETSEILVDSGTTRSEKDPTMETPSAEEKMKTLTAFSKFMQCRKLTSKLSRSDLEQFCIQKICESLMLKSSEGELHQAIKKHEKTIDNLRKDLQQLTKQCKDLEIVNRKLMNEIRNQNTLKKPLVPLKITRSVGLQVRLNPGNEIANQNRRRQPITTTPQKQTVGSTTNTIGTRGKAVTGNSQQTSAVRQVMQTTPQKSPLTAGQTTVNGATAPMLSQALSKRQTPVVAKRTTTARKSAEAPKPGNPGVIDLTDEDDKLAQSKSSVVGSTIKIVNKTTPSGGTQNKSLAANKIGPGGKTVVSQSKQVTVSKALTVGTNKGNTLSQGIRLTPASVITSSANGSAQMVYVVPTITSNAGGQQKVAFVNFQPTNGVLSGTLNGSTVSVMSNKQTLTLKTVPSPMRQKHPAPLPTPPRINLDPKLKSLLPKPLLTIKKIDTGIILQWKMPYNLDLYESIASYQLYAYQETSSPPNTDMWRKVGDVKALALPMACTLTQFADKNKYYFAVRSVDVHKRIGAFSDPEEISL